MWVVELTGPAADGLNVGVKKKNEIKKNKGPITQYELSILF